MLAGGLLALRFRPSRPLFVGCAAMIALPPVLVLLALGAPAAADPGALRSCWASESSSSRVFWDTALQQHVPEQALSRVSSYDALGSFIFIPLGQVVAGPTAEAIGIDETLYLAAGIVTLAVAVMVGTPDIRRLRRREGPELPVDNS